MMSYETGARPAGSEAGQNDALFVCSAHSAPPPYPPTYLPYPRPRPHAWLPTSARPSSATTHSTSPSRTRTTSGLTSCASSAEHPRTDGADTSVRLLALAHRLAVLPVLNPHTAAAPRSSQPRARATRSAHSPPRSRRRSSAGSHSAILPAARACASDGRVARRSTTSGSRCTARTTTRTTRFRQASGQSASRSRTGCVLARRSL
jgi:hypothetical protein